MAGRRTRSKKSSKSGSRGSRKGILKRLEKAMNKLAKSKTGMSFADARRTRKPKSKKTARRRKSKRTTRSTRTRRTRKPARRKTTRRAKRTIRKLGRRVSSGRKSKKIFYGNYDALVDGRSARRGRKSKSATAGKRRRPAKGTPAYMKRELKKLHRLQARLARS